MAELRAKVTSKGQLTIPKEIRRTLGIREGDSLVLELHDDPHEIAVRVSRKPVSFADYSGIWREGDGMNVDEVNSYVRNLRGRED